MMMSIQLQNNQMKVIQINLRKKKLEYFNKNKRKKSNDSNQDKKDKKPAKS